MARRPAAPVKDELVTSEELAEELRIPHGTIRSWRSRGKGPRWFSAGGKHVRYRRSEINRWLAEQGDTTMPARSV